MTRTHLVFFAWSTGNEIYDARYKHGENTLDMLTGWIKEIDTTRPVAKMPADLGQLLGK